MYKVDDLLLQFHPTKQTYLNYFKVFNIKVENFITSSEKIFNNNAVIEKKLFDYFMRNKGFFLNFYNDWHTKKTIRQLNYETGISLEVIIEMFNAREIYAKREMPILNPSYEENNKSFNIDTEFRYYSRYQIIELAFGKEIIARP